MNFRPGRLLRFLVCVLASQLVPLAAGAQQRFATAEQAAEALLQAAESEDPAAFAPLFGADFARHVSSGDPQADRLGIQRLGTLMRQGYKLTPRGPRYIRLELGAEKWPFPLPVALMDDGAWTFDAEDGKKELLRRRIAANEKRAVEIAELYAAAQRQYYTMTKTTTGIPSYAGKFLSSPGKKDGLYWDTGADGIASPLAKLVERAQNLGYEKRGQEKPLLMGYYYRVLTAQGEYAPGKTQSYLDAKGRMTKGFALLAYPSRYRISGTTSFLVGTAGLVYSRDLGEKTVALGERMKRFDPDPTWHPIAGGTPTSSRGTKVISTGDGTYPFTTDSW